MTYLTNSLFDYRSPENNGVRAEFILDTATHKVTKFDFFSKSPSPILLYQKNIVLKTKCSMCKYIKTICLGEATQLHQRNSLPVMNPTNITVCL